MHLIQKYFPELSESQRHLISMLWDLYHYWNQRINVISRKDIDHLYEHHVLHSLSLMKVVDFLPGSGVPDVGTGGGFPGIPLAICRPDVEFVLIDGISKKIRVVNEIIRSLQISNTRTQPIRAEQFHETFDYIVSRAVTNLPDFCQRTAKNLKTQEPGGSKGIYYLKGGALEEEINKISRRVEVFHIGDFIKEPFFHEKKIVFIPS